MPPRDDAQEARAAQRALLRPRRTSNAANATSETTITEYPPIDAKSVCRRCFGHAISKTDLLPPVAISSNGRAHKPASDDTTECGQHITDHWTRIG